MEIKVEDATNLTDKGAAAEKITEEQMAHGLNVDENMAGTQTLSEDIADNDESDKQKAELAEAKDKYLRLAAEFDNFRRRSSKERLELTATAGKEIIGSMLEVLDDVERASKQLETATDIDTIKEGINLVFNKLRRTLQSKGLKVMESQGQEFNPDLHEGITEIPAPTPGMVGKVVAEIEPGYYLNDKLIRHAKVVVGK